MPYPMEPSPTPFSFPQITCSQWCRLVPNMTLVLLMFTCIFEIMKHEACNSLTSAVSFPQVSTCSWESPITSKVPVSYESDWNFLACTNSPSKYVVSSVVSTCTVNATVRLLVHVKSGPKSKLLQRFIHDFVFFEVWANNRGTPWV